MKRIETDMVAAAAQTAKPHASEVMILETLATKAERIQGERSRMLPLEGAANEAAMRELDEITARLKSETSAKQVLKDFPTAQVLDSSVFGWRDKKGLPRLAPFSPESDAVAFVGENFSEKFPSSLRDYYKDVAPRLITAYSKCSQFFMRVAAFAMIGLIVSGIAGFYSWANALNWKAGYLGWPCLALIIIAALFPKADRVYRIEARFSGVIPEDVRETIRRAQQYDGFQEVFILAEVPAWKKSIEPTPVASRQPDPLVVAFDGSVYWLLAKFDVTTLEQAVSDEFTTKS